MRVSKPLTFKMRPSAKPFLWKWVLFVWELNRMKNYFHITDWALNLVLIQRLGGTRKCPIRYCIVLAYTLKIASGKMAGVQSRFSVPWKKIPKRNWKKFPKTKIRGRTRSKEGAFSAQTDGYEPVDLNKLLKGFYSIKHWSFFLLEVYETNLKNLDLFQNHWIIITGYVVKYFEDSPII